MDSLIVTILHDKRLFFETKNLLKSNQLLQGSNLFLIIFLSTYESYVTYILKIQVIDYNKNYARFFKNLFSIPTFLKKRSEIKEI